MRTEDPSGFDVFAGEFVRAYWETVKSGDFPMPPDEPVEETLEELLADVSHTTEVLSPCTRSEASRSLHMSNTYGDWWAFQFRESVEGWKLVSAAARSDDDTRPHDLLDVVYRPYFGPFIRHVTEVANKKTRG